MLPSSYHVYQWLTILVALMPTTHPNRFAVANEESDTFYIRHERSKVRHSNEKDHILWGMLSPQPQKHNESMYGSYDMSSATMHDNVTSGLFRGGGSASVSANSTISSIPSGNGHLFGSDYWLHSDVNGSLIKQVIIEEPPTPPSALNHRTQTTEVAPTPHAGATIMPVTHKIRKLHKKQIMESIRMNGNDKGRSAKNHRSLAEAEHIAGRPVTGFEGHNEKVASPSRSLSGHSELDEVLQLADELDVDSSVEQTADDVLADYLNDVEQNSEATTMTSRTDGDSQAKLFANDTFSPTIFGSSIGSQRNRNFVTSAVRPPKEPPEEDVSNGKHDMEQSTGRDNGAPLHDDMNTSIENDSLSDSLVETTTVEWVDSTEAESLGPNQLASTSVGGIMADRQQQSMEVDQIKFDADDDEGTMDDAFIIENKASGFPLSIGGGEDSEESESYSISNTDSPSNVGTVENDDEINPFLAGVVDGANEDEIYDWDEISRDNRRNLMRGRDVVTKFLQIVETQHLLGSNCEAGTSLYLGDGVVDRYAQDRFRVEAEVAVNRANMLTRIFKMTAHAVQADVNLLHASVLSMVEFDDDIFAAGNCFDWNEHPSQPGLFCPFAYRLPPPHLGAIFAKDLATEYHYLGNTSEWFFQARKNAEKVIARNEQYLKAFHLFSNKTDERIEDDTLAVKYEDGRWSKPYYDCGGGNIWMLTYTVPFFGYENGTYHFKGTSGIDIDLRRVDIDQCPQRNTPGTTQPLNIFAGTDKCKQRTTMCEALKGLGFRRGSYKCVCRKGYYFPDTKSTQKFFNGSLLEEEYEKLMLGNNSTYNIVNEYECLPCAEGCDSCEDGSPCIAALNWPMRTSILVLACTVIGLLPPAAWFTFRYQQVKVVRAASPALLRVIALGAFFIYCTNIVMYPNPNLYTCTARIWLREIGFSLTYGALMLKTWRISVIFRVRSAKAVKITDAALLKRLGIICGVIGTCLLVRTLVSPPDVVVGRTADDLKAFLCKTDWWDYTFTSMEVFFLAWGVRLCIMVRKAPSEFNESRFISMAIYNEFLLTCFLNVSMIFLQSPANPDLLYIIFFCHTQLTVTLLLALIFGSKVYIVLRSGKSHQENIGMNAKASGAKFNFRPQVRTFANPSSITTSTVPMAGTTSAENKLSDQEALEEIRQLSMQLQRIQEMAPPKGVAVMTISSLLDGLKTPGGMMMVAAAASQAIAAPPASCTGNQLTVRHQATPQAALPLLAINNEMHMYTQHQQNNNKPAMSKVVRSDKSVNTDYIGGHLICSRCLEESTRQLHYRAASTRCQQLGSPPPEGSISFSNIKLECMCSQPDLDVDSDVDTGQKIARRRLQVRTAATNTPTGKRRSSKTKKTGPEEPHDVVSYQICDKCKKKYGRAIDKRPSDAKTAKLRTKKDGKRFGKGLKNSETMVDTPKCVTLTCSTELFKATSTASSDRRKHSSDDIIFYTTTTTSSTSSCDEQSESDASDHQSHESSSSSSDGNDSDVNRLPPIEGSAKTTANDDASHAKSLANPTRPTLPNTDGLAESEDNNQPSTSGEATNKSNGNGNRPKRPDKLVLDLNDRSKYTKEVSV